MIQQLSSLFQSRALLVYTEQLAQHSSLHADSNITNLHHSSWGSVLSLSAVIASSKYISQNEGVMLKITCALNTVRRIWDLSCAFFSWVEEWGPGVWVIQLGPTAVHVITACPC